MTDRIWVAQPNLAGNERKYVLDCLDSTWISSTGEYITAFENHFAQFCETKHAIATNNGTTALHLALLAHDLKAQDEVLIPAITFIATANAVRYCGGVPVLVDVCKETMTLDPTLMEKKITKKTRGIIAVHLYGHPTQMTMINAIANKYHLWVIEDAAEAHGALYLGRKVGGLGDCAAFSFFGNKIITTGEGGMVTTNNDALAIKIRLFRGQGVDPERRYWFPVVGYNYRMTNIQAAIGLAQLEQIDAALAARETLANWYQTALSPLKNEIQLLKSATWAKKVWWMFNIFLRHGNGEKRNTIMRMLDEKGIETRPIFYPLHVLPPYKEDASYPVAELSSQQGISLPTHQGLKKTDVDRIVNTLKQVLDKVL